MIVRLASVMLLVSAVMLLASPAPAEDYAALISEDYLRSEFSFGPGEALKLAECKKNSYPTCTYVWGEPSEKDAAAAKYGVTPKGKRLILIYAQAKRAKDFEQATGVYSDAEKVAGLGAQAVWSSKRKQLTLITREHLIIHVNTERTKSPDLKAKATRIAEHVLEALH
jgi:hypothetical protein